MSWDNQTEPEPLQSLLYVIVPVNMTSLNTSIIVEIEMQTFSYNGLLFSYFFNELTNFRKVSCDKSRLYYFHNNFKKSWFQIQMKAKHNAILTVVVIHFFLIKNFQAKVFNFISTIGVFKLCDPYVHFSPERF